jgi:hypothetical protein
MLLKTCGSSVDIVGLDYYPGTWTMSARSDANNWERFSKVIAKHYSTRGSVFYHRTFAILETGYSTNIGYLRGERQQAEYLQTLTTAMQQLDDQIGRSNLFLVGIHELTDEDSEAALDPEAHFGMLQSKTMKRKASFDAVKHLFDSLA